MKTNSPCEFCKSVHKNPYNLKESYISACENDIEWLDYLGTVSDINDNTKYQILDSMPSISEEKIIRVWGKTICKEVDTLFWTFFTPALTYLNGTDIYFNEVESSAFVQCRVISVFPSKIHYVTAQAGTELIKVSINDVKPLSQHANLIPPSKETNPLLDQICDFKGEVIIYKNWIYYLDNEPFENYWLIVNVIDDQPFLVAIGSTHFLGGETAHMCNMALSDETYTKILNVKPYQSRLI